ncbi:type II secretion system F family protein [Agromyces atrinae]|uniref:type II secretion system F family protein n=1 Tax=Agromyces atrinae TaxID=592376 RepID=UPI001F57C3DA|nr:type II secretion system F family protein [Agromyces atrinae]MCI2959121.1 type II secretion system F family protein [Agromyces atrinae]
MNSIAWGAVLGVGALLIASPWLWPHTGERRPESRPISVLRTDLALAGVSRVPPIAFLLISLLVGIVVAAIVFAVTLVMPLAVAALFVGGTSPWLVVRARANQRRASHRGVWPDIVDHLVSAVRSGLALPDAVMSLASVGPEETRAEFRRFARSYRASGNFSASIDELKDGLGDAIADRILETLRMAREVGGSDLVAVLRSLAAYLREDQAIRTEVAGRQSWVTNAARLGVAAPWVLLFMLASRPEAAVAYNSPAGATLIVGGLVVSIVAYRIMMAIGRLPAERRWFG